MGHTTNTESVSLFSDTNLENSKRENRPTSSRVISIRGYRRGAVAYFISRLFQNPYPKISFQHHAFCFYMNHYRGADSKI